mmetsp:Transcript_76673/g.215600  ORF Transcript_76673/g.215600 Transcript_76673/m.215600 type:complete len:364 (-) Transcript_76673:935-2026(-)
MGECLPLVKQGHLCGLPNDCQIWQSNGTTTASKKKRKRKAPSAQSTGTLSKASISRLLLHGQGQLQGLLLPALHDLLPQLTLVLHALELRLDVLLGDLQEPQDAVVRLLRDHVQDVAEALRAALPPSLVHAKGHVLRAFLPTQELHIGLALVSTFTTPFVNEATQCFKSSKGFSLTLVSSTSCTASICAFQFCSSMFLCFSILRVASLFFWMSTSCEALFTVKPFTSSRSFKMSRLCSPRPPCTPLMRKSRAPNLLEASALRSSACCSTALIFSKASCCFCLMSFFKRASVSATLRSKSLRTTATSLKQSLKEFCVVCKLSCVAAKSLFVKSMRPFKAFTAWSVSLVILALDSSKFVSTAVMS